MAKKIMIRTKKFIILSIVLTTIPLLSSDTPKKRVTFNNKIETTNNHKTRCLTLAQIQKASQPTTSPLDISDLGKNEILTEEESQKILQELNNWYAQQTNGLKP